MEAVFGGVFIDGGIDSARAVVERLYADLWPKSAAKVRRKDFKTKPVSYTHLDVYKRQTCGRTAPFPWNGRRSSIP